MSIRVEWDVPYGGESAPFGDLVAFVERSQALGADPDTPVLAVTAPQDDGIGVAFRVDLEVDASAARPSVVSVPRSEVVEAIGVLEAIEDNEGDARMQLAAVRELRQLLTKLAVA
jgi:hypothetical protein